MFWIAPWSLQADIAGCQQQFGLTPRPNMVRIEYGVTDLSGASNIVFSNGNLDPWSSGGVLTNVTGAIGRRAPARERAGMQALLPAAPLTVQATPVSLPWSSTRVRITWTCVLPILLTHLASSRCGWWSRQLSAHGWCSIIVALVARWLHDLPTIEGCARPHTA